MDSIKSTSLLRYKGVSQEDIRGNDQNLVSKEYVEDRFYPYKSPTLVSSGVGDQYSINPSVTDSYWSIIDPEITGTVVIRPEDKEYSDYAVFTFELMVVRPQDNNSTITFQNGIEWIGNEPTIEPGKIYFLVFRMIYIGGSWKIIGNIQGILSI